MFLVYDSNAGSFEAEGKPFLNVYDSKLETLSYDQEDSGLREMQGIMAHELQHVLARPYLYPVSGADRAWQRRWVDRITRGIVGEGVANHCNPPEGFKKEVHEDGTVVSALVTRLNALLAALSANEMREDEVQDWYRENYFEVAEDLLRGHLEKLYSGKELEQKLRAHMPLRPDLGHALGWWMVSRVSRDGARRQAAVDLMHDPYSIYALYNEAVPADREELRISPEAMRYLGSLQDTPASKRGPGED